ncbi:hypothetical protein [Pseudoxanthomonas suwonensis]|uniref:Secreted protein n=1 Tax=Pseudoxanthomonas suwonensis TaxID=314722 RepID=A0A0E3UN86_9GAMM|nr:hypothetical protein [Pseudoxanthomonas suwonensis]AKC86971.1 hypothetical protein WQ53_09625 [Pseudoxanthomonas suwonensis]
MSYRNSVATVLLCCAGLLLATACSRGPQDAPATMSAAQDLPTGPAPAPDPHGTPDPAVVERLIAAGIEPAEARLLALTTSQTSQPEPGLVQLVMTYPWGDVYRAGIRARRVGADEVKPFEVLASSITPQRISGTFRYYVDLADLPPEALASLAEPARAAPSMGLIDFFIASAHAQQLREYAGPNAVNDDGGFMEIVYNWAIGQAGDEARDAVVGTAFGEKAGGGITKALDALKAAEAFARLSDKTPKMLDELDRLRACAENPTNPLTRRFYEQNPGEKDRILDLIDGAKAHIVGNAVGSASGTLGNLISSAGKGAVKIVGVALGPLVDKAQADIDGLNRTTLQELRNRVPSCGGRSFHFSCGGHDPIEQDVCDIRTSFVLNGPLFGHELSGGLTGTTRIVRTPSSAGVHWGGSGTYAITFPDGEGKPGTMQVQAEGATRTSGGLAQTTGDEMCTLTPIDSCRD